MSAACHYLEDFDKHVARHGVSRRGEAWRGKTWRGKTRFFNHGRGRK